MRFRIYYRTIAFWLGIAAFVYNIDQVSMSWLGLSAAVYFYLTIVMSVGYHRLFSHNSFSCHRAWHWLFAISGSASLMASPLQWATSHKQHHIYSDTDNDPQVTSMLYFFRLNEKNTSLKVKPPRKMLLDPMHRFIHRYCFGFFLVGFILASLVSFNFLVFGFMFPISLAIFAIGMHHIFSHRNKRPVNLPAMEFILPIAGEWIHKVHHDNQFLWSAGKLDLGALVIRAIKNG